MAAYLITAIRRHEVAVAIDAVCVFCGVSQLSHLRQRPCTTAATIKPERNQHEHWATLMTHDGLIPASVHAGRNAL